MMDVMTWQASAKVFVKKSVHEKSLRITIASVPSW